MKSFKKDVWETINFHLNVKGKHLNFMENNLLVFFYLTSEAKTLFAVFIAFQVKICSSIYLRFAI